jgi:histidinol-phosphate aminotransferase
MNTTARALLRGDLRDFGGYRSARGEAVTGEVWLNANESAWANRSDAGGGLHRYPPPQPQALLARLAALYEVEPDQLLVGRGSDEAIDLLVRAFCAPGAGAIVTTPPVFGMYAVCARLHGVRNVEVPLVDGEDGLSTDLRATADAALERGASIVFLCSPGNPSGEALPLADIAALAARLRGKAMVVVDEAYVEYSDLPSASVLLPAHDNLAVLRTLSKAHALAAARVGCVLAARDAIEALRRCQAPYPIPQPAAVAALAALSPWALAATAVRVDEIRALRARVAEALRGLPQVLRVYPSAGNFLLVRFADADAAFARLIAAGVVVRDMRAMPRLGDALRISIGAPGECRRLLEALGASLVGAAA